MRRIGLTLVLLLSLALSLTVALSLPAEAGAASLRGPKVEERLAALADSKGQEDELDVIVLGAEAADKGRKLGQLKRGLDFVGGASVKVKVKHLDKLASEEGVSFLALDAPIAPQGVVDYSKLTTLYPQIDKVTAGAWDQNLDGTGVGIAVIDSGVAPVSDFAGRLVQVELPFQSWTSDDLHGHGSLVAGIAGGKSPDGKFIGVAPGARIYALNVNRPEGPRSADVIDALQWVHENAQRLNIRVVNLSLSETVPSSYKDSPLDLAVERVWAAGIAVVVSAGNGGLGAVNYAPSNDPLAMTVGSYDDKATKDPKDDALSSFTATGVTVDGFAKPELLAPGRLLASTLPAGSYLDATAPAQNKLAPGYATISGTSFSAPQVAAAAAILFQQHPEWSPDNVKSMLLQKGRVVSLTTIPALAIDKAVSTRDAPGRANQGVPALVCAPGTTCLTGTTVASLWDSASWNAASWNAASWNAASWNAASWNAASWNAASWSAASWNAASWNAASWNSYSWN